MSLKYHAVLFDLDGTLTDSGPAITGSVRCALEQMDVPVPPRETLLKFVGPPLYPSFRSFCGMTDSQAQEAIRLYRQDYDGRDGAFRASVYPGVPELLAALRGEGAYLAVATSKPIGMTRRVLSHFGLASSFDFVSAPPASMKDLTKDAVILPALEAADCPASSAVMIGDTRFDAEGARLAGTPFIGVLYGFGSEAEMRAEGASLFADSATGLLPLLLDNP